MRKAHAVRSETRDVDARLILAFAGGLVAFILIVLGAMRLIFGVTPLPLPFGAGTGLFGSGNPVLETDTVADRAAYDAGKQKELNALTWVDRSAGIAHIPIDEAMRMIAASGVPDWGQHATSAGGGCGAVAEQVPRAPVGTGCPSPAATP
jgi:hypothetical protein